MSIEVTSDKNYMKRQLAGSANLAAPATVVGASYYYKTTLVINHNQGRIPYFTVDYEGFKDGVLWPPMGIRGFGASNPRVNPASLGGPCLTAFPGLNTLTLELSYFDNSLIGTYPVNWVIYYDYGL